MKVEFKEDDDGDINPIINDPDAGPICMGYIDVTQHVFIPFEDVWFDADELMQIGMKMEELAKK